MTLISSLMKNPYSLILTNISTPYTYYHYLFTLYSIPPSLITSPPHLYLYSIHYTHITYYYYLYSLIIYPYIYPISLIITLFPTLITHPPHSTPISTHHPSNGLLCPPISYYYHSSLYTLLNHLSIITPTLYSPLLTPPSLILPNLILTSPPD